MNALTAIERLLRNPSVQIEPLDFILALDDTPAEAREGIRGLLAARLRNPRLQSVSFSDSVTTVHCSFTGLSGDTLDDLKSALEEIAPVRKVNLFFNRQGVLT